MKNGVRYGVVTAGLAALLGAFALPTPAQTAQGTAPRVGKEQPAPQRTLPPAQPTPRTADGRPDLSGVWAASTTGVIDLRAPRLGAPPPERAEPPSFQRWVLEKQKRVGPLDNATPGLLCEPEGAVSRIGGPYPLQIIQTPQIIAILTEHATTHRRIWIDGRSHREDADPMFGGDAIGRWEGDTLVTSLKALDTRQWVGPGAFFISDVAQITERFTRPDSNTLLYQYTVNDPKVLTKPWTSPVERLTLALSPMVEYYCTNERDAEVFLKEGRTYISPTGVDERFFDEDEYEELKKQFP